MTIDNKTVEKIYEKIKELPRFNFLLNPTGNGVKRWKNDNGDWIERYEVTNIIENAIEANQAIIAEYVGSGEAVATVEVWNEGGSGEHRTANGIDKLPHGTKLFTHAKQDDLQANEPDWVKAGDGTLHGAIDYWQNKASDVQAKLDVAVECLELYSNSKRVGLNATIALSTINKE